jgi:hypothetical protein
MEYWNWNTESIASALMYFASKVFACDEYDSRLVFDVSTYAPLRFEKRARLFVLMYEGRARSSSGKLPTLNNLEAIGPVIDYQVPKTLRHLGILVYTFPVANLVDNNEFIEVQSREEVAIRVAAYVATEELNKAINELRADPITMVELDYLLWSEGRKAQGNHHLTLTDRY